jgi:coniferyl-aldehyde dehydrogenase
MDTSLTEQLHLQLQAQSAAFHSEPFPTLAVRRERLERLRTLLSAHQDAFIEAVNADFSHRSAHETRLAELLMLEAGLKHTLRHLKSWMNPRRMPTALHFLPGSSQLMPQPLGVVGVISPWNYPVQLALAPAMAALAAGNRVMLKPSELTPCTSALLAQAVAAHFSPDEFTVIQGDAGVARQFASLPFNHLFFTGSTPVGREVAKAAAANLTPVTLELGGKSPAVVDASADIAQTAERLAFGKLLNAGQTCVAPDYILAPHAMVEPLAEALVAAIRRLYPTLAKNPDYSAIATPRHHARLKAMLEEAESLGARLMPTHKERLGVKSRKLVPTVVLDTTPQMQLMREEIFGPVLPIVGYVELEEAICTIQRGERPLALYWFGADNAGRERLLKATHSGGVTINDCLWHLAQEDLPFGGVGASGQGAYHGEWGFNTFSHRKPIFNNPALAATKLFYPPYGAVFNQLLGVLKRIA